MQSIRALILVLAAASCTLLADCAADRASSDYIDNGAFSSFNNPATVLGHITRNINNGRVASAEDPVKMLSVFSRISESSREIKEREFYRNLIGIANEEKCSIDMLRYGQAIIKLSISTTKESVQDYLGFIEKFGAHKFSALAQEMMEQFWQIEKSFERRFEWGLDEFITTFVADKKGSQQKVGGKLRDDASLLEVAKELDLTSVSYPSVSKVQEIAKQSILNYDDYQKQPWKLVEIFLTQHCDAMQGLFQVVFDAYNLSRALGASVQDVPTKFLKLNEYNRVCLSWQNNSDAARDNLIRAMKGDKWFRIKWTLGRA